MRAVDFLLTTFYKMDVRIFAGNDTFEGKTRTGPLYVIYRSVANQ